MISPLSIRLFVCLSDRLSVNRIMREISSDLRNLEKLCCVDIAKKNSILDPIQLIWPTGCHSDF